MATVEARGYVNRPEAKTTGSGQAFSVFNLGVKQKKKSKDGQETVTWANYRVTDWNNSSPPPEKAYVTVKGYLTVEEVEKNGRHYTNLQVKATELEVAPPLEGGSNSGGGSAEPDPWE